MNEEITNPPTDVGGYSEKQISESRKALVAELTDTVRDARKFWSRTFETMREDIEFAGGDQWGRDAVEAKLQDKYQVNFVQRELNQEVSAIYARNPTVVCQRRRRLEYAVWDGTKESLEAAKAAISEAAARDLQLTQQGQQPIGPPGEAAAIVADYAAGAQRKKMIDKIADTLELVVSHQLDEQQPDFAGEMKNLVMREKTTGAGFVTVKYHRQNESVPSANATQADVLKRIQSIHAAAQTAVEEGYAVDSPCHEDIRLMLAALTKSLQGDDAKVLMEGIVLDWHPSTAVIVDPNCRNLCGFVGADWVAEELRLSPERIQEQWGVDVKASTATVEYKDGQEALRTKAGGERTTNGAEWEKGGKCCVWIIYHKTRQLQYVICDGYDDFLEEPAAPWPEVKGFWPILALKLTKIEIEENKPTLGVTIYGESAARLLRPMQEEMNRSQEGLREHRVANRPGHLCGKETFSTPDRMNLANRNAHDVIPLDNMPPGSDCSKAMVAIPVNQIDPALYRTDHVMQHALLVTGQQQANLGQQQSNEKATGQAIAEQSRIQNASSEVDSIDKFLSELVRIAGEMCLTVMDASTAKTIAGPGGAWPETPEMRLGIREHLYLQIEAASTGRPNRAMEIDNLERMMPQLTAAAAAMNLPLDPLIKYAAKVLEFDFDIDEWLAMAKPAQAGPPGKGASESISIKLGDLTPEERAQALALAGIRASGGPPPQDTGNGNGAGGSAGPSGAAPGLPSMPAQVKRMLPAGR